MMATGKDSVKEVEKLGVKNPEKGKVLSKKKNVKKDGDESESGFWFRFKLMFSCISSRSKVDSSMNATTVIEPKHIIEKREGHQAPSKDVSCAESGSSTPLMSGELKYSSKLRIFMFNDLKLATRNFRPESLLGEGGFGCVFKGWIEENGTAPVKPGTGLTVAVKTLNPDGLQGTLPLPWSVRMKIALGAAKGLAFLHEEAEKPVIYRDFKTSNILLDAEYNSKLSDFGLAKDAPDEKKSHVSTRVMGTYGYAAPEYVMTDKKRFYRLLDPRLEGHFSIKGAQKATQVAAQCLNRDSKARPKMSEVVEALKPLPNMKDFASSSSSFQTMQPVAKNGIRTQGGGFVSRNGPPLRSLSSLNLPQASPYRYARQSPKPKGKEP
ncbi:unnamed protein product [Thlaspi arvense]|uniref:non-specific serine/threonine protein kinase n=1 Tax=Thlaspi arvense TaxID=13288 RepID=A0AAU9RKE4_THLAR|nr:unnamed protein product [Thlaspi arvense]